MFPLYSMLSTKTKIAFEKAFCHRYIYCTFVDREQQNKLDAPYAEHELYLLKGFSLGELNVALL